MNYLVSTWLVAVLQYNETFVRHNPLFLYKQYTCVYNANPSFQKLPPPSNKFSFARFLSLSQNSLPLLCQQFSSFCRFLSSSLLLKWNSKYFRRFSIKIIYFKLYIRFTDTLMIQIIRIITITIIAITNNSNNNNSNNEYYCNININNINNKYE